MRKSKSKTSEWFDKAMTRLRENPSDVVINIQSRVHDKDISLMALPADKSSTIQGLSGDIIIIDDPCNKDTDER